MSDARWEGDDLILTLRVLPRAARDELRRDAGGLKLRITAPPVDGKANAHLRRYLAKALGVARGRVEILAGESGRDKRVIVRGADRRKAAALGLCGPD